MKRRGFFAWLIAALFGTAAHGQKALDRYDPNQTRVPVASTQPQPFVARIIKGTNPYLCERVAITITATGILGIATDTNGRTDLPTDTIVKIEPFAGGYRFKS